VVQGVDSDEFVNPRVGVLRSAQLPAHRVIVFDRTALNRVQATTQEGGGSWSTPVTLRDVYGSTSERPVFDAAGNAHAIFRAYASDTHIVAGARRAPGRRLGIRRLLGAARSRRRVGHRRHRDTLCGRLRLDRLRRHVARAQRRRAAGGLAGGVRSPSSTRV